MIRESLLYPPSYSVVSSSARKSSFCDKKMDRDEVSESQRNLSDSAETFGAISHSAPTNQQLDLLGSEQIFQRRLVGDHVEASPERFELLLHALVQHVICVLSDKLLHKKQCMVVFNR